MIDQFAIMTKGGVVLWSQDFMPIRGQPVDGLIRNVLIEVVSIADIVRCVDGVFSGTLWSFGVYRRMLCSKMAICE